MTNSGLFFVKIVVRSVNNDVFSIPESITSSNPVYSMGNKRSDVFTLPEQLTDSDSRFIKKFVIPGSSIKIHYDTDFNVFNINDRALVIVQPTEDPELDVIPSSKNTYRMTDKANIPKFTITLTLENGREYKDVVVLDTKEKRELVRECIAVLDTSSNDKFYTSMIDSLKK